MAVLRLVGVIVRTAVRVTIAHPALRDAPPAGVALEEVVDARLVRTVGEVLVRLVDAVDRSVADQRSARGILDQYSDS